VNSNPSPFLPNLIGILAKQRTHLYKKKQSSPAFAIIKIETRVRKVQNKGENNLNKNGAPNKILF
jgi:hypothetical protein